MVLYNFLFCSLTTNNIKRNLLFIDNQMLIQDAYLTDITLCRETSIHGFIGGVEGGAPPDFKT
jgi:hypothetical protein